MVTTHLWKCLRYGISQVLEDNVETDHRLKDEHSGWRVHALPCAALLAAALSWTCQTAKGKYDGFVRTKVTSQFGLSSVSLRAPLVVFQGSSLRSQTHHAIVSRPWKKLPAQLDYRYLMVRCASDMCRDDDLQ